MERLSLHGKSSGESFQQSAEDDLIISNALDTDDGDSCVHEEDHGEEHWQDVDDGETSGSHAIAPLGMMGRTRNGFAKNKMPMRVEKVFRRARSLTGPSPVYNFGPKARTMKNSAGLMSIQDPASLRLTWYKTPFSVLVIKKIYDEDIIRPFVEIISHLVKERRMMVYVEEAILKDVKLNSNEDFDRLKDKLYTVSEGQDDLTDKIDFILCLGGDGTLLHASSLFQTSVPPVLAFHLGSLGFLTIFEYAENFKSVLTSVLEGNAKLSLRSRLKCAITKVDSDLSRIPVKNLQASHQKSMMVLNEVVIDRGPSPYLTNLDLYVEGRYVTSVQGDGLIISTPTGSTAYAVSAGASLVHPSVPAIMITPICPHSLSFRPIVLPAGVEIKVMVSPEARSTAWVSYDGRNRHELAHGELLRVATAIYPVPCICRDDQIMDWFDCLGTCMHWNVRHRQKPFIGIGNGMTPSSSSNSLCSRNSGSDTNCDNSY
ncbi:PREDICTED: NAD kinase-like isoform X2 [Priapulus caudatus]|uniref:NAD(+) kinase n=1 Tax=Priapulus caudatus TaxID=37621 RepID=A0ABM1DU54_PRICU|nr:PREDICTED: NAD kinase-like isoform X2 [Priapulus caudatus]